MKRLARLTLKKETLAALSAEEMTLVAGAPNHTLEVGCFVVAVDLSLPPACAIPTFHRAAC